MDDHKDLDREEDDEEADGDDGEAGDDQGYLHIVESGVITRSTCHTSCLFLPPDISLLHSEMRGFQVFVFHVL